MPLVQPGNYSRYFPSVINSSLHTFVLTTFWTPVKTQDSNDY